MIKILYQNNVGNPSTVEWTEHSWHLGRPRCKLGWMVFATPIPVLKVSVVLLFDQDTIAKVVKSGVLVTVERRPCESKSVGRNLFT